MSNFKTTKQTRLDQPVSGSGAHPANQTLFSARWWYKMKNPEQKQKRNPFLLVLKRWLFEVNVALSRTCLCTMPLSAWLRLTPWSTISTPSNSKHKCCAQMPPKYRAVHNPESSKTRLTDQNIPASYQAPCKSPTSTKSSDPTPPRPNTCCRPNQRRPQGLFITAESRASAAGTRGAELQTEHTGRWCWEPAAVHAWI